MTITRALLVLAALAGCIGPSASPPHADCSVPATAATGPFLVHVQLANTMTEAACVQLFLDGALAGAADLPAEDSGLHANPRSAGDTRAARADVLARVQDAATGRGHEERVTLRGESWVVGWLDESGGNVEVYATEPAWM